MSAIRQQEQQMRLWVPTEFLMFQILMIMVLFAFFRLLSKMTVGYR